MQVRTGGGDGFRPLFEGTDAASCRLVGLDAGALISVRVCYEVESGPSHWRYIDVRTKMSLGTQKQVAAAFIAKFLVGLWDRSRARHDEIKDARDTRFVIFGEVGYFFV